MAVARLRALLPLAVLLTLVPLCAAAPGAAAEKRIIGGSNVSIESQPLPGQGGDRTGVITAELVAVLVEAAPRQGYDRMRA